MTPAQIAESILSTRYPTAHPGSAFYQNAHTMIVDGIERALADRQAEHAARLAVARSYAEWHIGDGSWAEVIVDAYLDHENAREALREEQEDQAYVHD